MLQLTHPSTTAIPKFVTLQESYEQCRQITAECSKTFYMGTLLMPEAKRRAIWAIYVWCRRTDELVDGPQAKFTTESTLDHWESQLELLFSGHPKDDLDVAMVDTLEPIRPGYSAVSRYDFGSADGSAAALAMRRLMSLSSTATGWRAQWA